jgi:GTP cyclohydrolase I
MLDFVKPVADVQGGADHRNIDIDKVGIRNIRHPVRVRDHSDGEQHTVACFNMSVNPPRQFKGTHM